MEHHEPKARAGLERFAVVAEPWTQNHIMETLERTVRWPALLEVMDGDDGQVHYRCTVPVWQVRTQRSHAWMEPDGSGGERMCYLAVEVASAVCNERLRMLRTRTNPWAIPPASMMKPLPASWKVHPGDKVLELWMSRRDVIAREDAQRLPPELQRELELPRIILPGG